MSSPNSGSQQTPRCGCKDEEVSRNRLLVVDDETNLRSMLCAALSHRGFDVEHVDNGHAALVAVERDRPDLVVLDVLMPELDGFEVCRRLRASGDHTPVLFLTARDDVADRVHGLSLGADDYLQKPFNLDELVARALAILRRSNAATPPAVFRIADLEMDDAAHRVMRSGIEISLSPTEYRLLRFLLVNQRQALSKTQILDHVWDDGFAGDGAIVETYIGYLRRKLDQTEPKLIHTIRGIGYIMRTR